MPNRNPGARRAPSREGQQARVAGFVVGAATMAALAAGYVLSPPSMTADLLALAVSLALALSVVVVGCRLAIQRDRAERARLDAEAVSRAAASDRDRQLQRMQAAIDNMSQGLCMFGPDRRLVVSNTRYADLYGIPRDQVRPGMMLDEIVSTRIAAGNVPVVGEERLRSRFTDVVAQGEPKETLVEQEDGRVFLLGYTPLEEGGWVATHQDITERRAAEKKIAFMLRHDSLTHLPNRFTFRKQLEEALAQLDDDEPLAILCVDLDRFKGVNDTLGHHAGDLLLREVASRLTSCLREGDIVARLSGDEFAIVQRHEPQPEAATALAQRIVEAISAPCDLDGHQVVVGASVGFAIAPADGLDAERLMKNADLALYRSKADGRSTFCRFTPEMDARMQERRALEASLRSAMALRQFELYYQPIVGLAAGEIEGFEALLRWHHPTRGLVSPADFIDVAEEMGLIVPLGDWVIRTACREAATWPLPVKVAVNLSPLQLRSPNLVATVEAALADSRLAPHRLELEITETVLLQDSDATLATLNALRDLGALISMDDFGTGYSSLSYLRKFPFSKIKIDRSFVHDLALHEDSLAIVRAVATLGKSLGIATTAEGVETAEQLERVRAEGCTEVQGFFFGKAQPAAEIPRLLKARGGEEQAVA